MRKKNKKNLDMISGPFIPHLSAPRRRAHGRCRSCIGLSLMPASPVAPVAGYLIAMLARPPPSSSHRRGDALPPCPPLPLPWWLPRFVRFSACPSVCPSGPLSACLSACLSAWLSACLSVSVSSACLSIRLSIGCLIGARHLTLCPIHTIRSTRENLRKRGDDFGVRNGTSVRQLRHHVAPLRHHVAPHHFARDSLPCALPHRSRRVPCCASCPCSWLIGACDLMA